MEQNAAGLTISFVDKEHRAAYLEYDGCSITLNFAKEPNPEVKDFLKDVLIGSVIDRTKESHNCVNARGERRCRQG